MPRPADIHANGRTYRWDKLDPIKAGMGGMKAEWGLRGPKGSTFLLWPCTLYADWSHHITAVGLWSGLANLPDGGGDFDTIATEIESLATCHPYMTGMDERVKLATYVGWKVEG